MSRFFPYMVGLGIVALVAAIMMLLRPSSPGSSFSTEFSGGKQPGTPAISHGGPAPAGSQPAPAARDTLGLGREAELADATSLLAAVPTAPDAEPMTVGTTIPAGTMATIIAIAPAVPPDTAQAETFYKVQLKDGQAGWVAEHKLRPAKEQAH